jgi:hypothetical protein
VSVIQGLPLVADSTAVSIEATDSDGRVRYRRDYWYRPTRVSDAHVSRVVDDIASDERYLAPFGSVAMLGRAVRDSLTVPEFLPAVTDVVAGDDGSVWLRRTGVYDDGPAEWLVLDAAGDVAMTVTAPREANVLAARMDNLWATQIDEAGVMRIVRYRIE